MTRVREAIDCGPAGPFLRKIVGGYAHGCPGCRSMHGIATTLPQEGNAAQWEFNDNLVLPSFEPGLRLLGPKGVCHYKITDGTIYYRACQHELSEQAVALPILEGQG